MCETHCIRYPTVIIIIINYNDKNIDWKWLKINKIHHMLDARCSMLTYVGHLSSNLHTALSTMYFHIEIRISIKSRVQLRIMASAKLMALINISIRYRMFLQWTQLYIVVSILKWNPYHSSFTHPTVPSISFICFIPCWQSITPVIGMAWTMNGQNNMEYRYCHFG